MRAFGSGCLLVWMASILLGAQAQLPPDHPPVGTSDGRSAASDLTERLRPSSSTPASKPVARRNLIVEFIFGKMEQDGVPHAGLSSDEEFFRRIHIDLTGRLPLDDQLRAFPGIERSRQTGQADRPARRVTCVRHEVDLLLQRHLQTRARPDW